MENPQAGMVTARRPDGDGAQAGMAEVRGLGCRMCDE
jgi:hypothetical protein